MLTVQNHEIVRQSPDPSPLFGGGVWARDYPRDSLSLGGAYGTWNGKHVGKLHVLESDLHSEIPAPVVSWTKDFA